jgi:hypothetical protein
VEETDGGDYPAGGDCQADWQLGSRRRSKTSRPTPHGGQHCRGFNHASTVGRSTKLVRGKEDEAIC